MQGQKGNFIEKQVQGGYGLKEVGPYKIAYNKIDLNKQKYASGIKNVHISSK